MKNKAANYLSKREQQIMELLYRKEPATANDLMALLPGEPSNSTVRTLLRILEEKGQVTKTEEDGKYIYSPAKAKKAAAKTALNRVLDTFYQGSVRDVVATLLDEEKNRLSDEDLDQLQEMIDKAREEGR
jgi:BlaI family transcriptional regulator, penicillinase repressor